MPNPSEKTQSGSPDLPPRAAARHAITDIRRHFAKKHWLATFVVGAVLLLYLVTTVILAARLRSLIPAVASLMLLVSAVLLFRVIRNRILREHIRQVVAGGGHQPVEDLAASCLALEGEVVDDFRFRLKEFLCALVASGRPNNTLRIAPQERDESLKPFELPFEPQALDEADPNFIQLESQRDVDTGESSSPAPASVEGDATWRRVRRNVVLRGGSLVVGFFLGAALLSAWLSYRQGRIHPRFALYSGLFLLTLFGTAGSWSSRKQWLALAGGLLLRKARWRSRQWRLYLFEPRYSALALYRRNKHLWILCIAQGDSFERTTLTNREADFVLRAWLSPLSPPPIEKLTDLL